MNVIDKLEKYIPVNEQETVDKEAMISFIKHNEDAFFRSNLIGHVTSSAIIMNKERNRVLFAHHKIYDSWAWTGGHNDGDEDCLYVALKEAKEETGLEHVTPLTEEIAGIDIIYVMQHIKNGKHVSDHLHLNLTYILIADENDKITHKADENNDVAWFDVDDVYNHVTEPRMIPIYEKMLRFARNYGK